MAQELLRLIDLEKIIVTADAMNCQKDTAAATIAGKGDYVLLLKGNQGLFMMVCSIGEDADEFERAARGHWGGGKTLALAVLRLVKESYMISMKRIRYELSLDYEKGIEKLLSLVNIENIGRALESEGRSPSK